ncbi:Guanylate kinase [Auxenochlorella protothecoides]|uniref:guanylate kinase n=1 Tax=Auxenochlorella protothecoides TaxID=3075 RepID=A0A087SBU9_AUXPR|nr:Guanylate kinase [Auxenochlorella protothecoides]KFM23203.1 Guanylate kinase [Auxenochlorella protothecoides]
MGQNESSGVEMASEEAAPRPCALVVVGPSGVGKGTLISKLMQSSSKYGFSCSHTTRAPRPGEKDGEHYHFTTRAAFEAGIARGDFLEHAHVHGNIYGTSVQSVRDVADAGLCCVLDIDVQGARQVRAAGLPALFVFIAPPGLTELEARLRGRGTDSEEQIRTRLATAAVELESRGEEGLYDYILGSDVQEGPGRQPPESTSGLRGVELATIEGPGAAGDAAIPMPAGAEDVATATPPAASPASLAVPSAPGSILMVLHAGAPLGAELCCQLAAAGARVVAVAGDAPPLLALQERVQGLGAAAEHAFLPVVADLEREGEVLALPRIVAERWGGDAAVSALVVCPPDEPPAEETRLLVEAPAQAAAAALAMGLAGPAAVVRSLAAAGGEAAGPLRFVAIVREPARGGGWPALAERALRQLARQLAQEEGEKAGEGARGLVAGTLTLAREEAVRGLGATLLHGLAWPRPAVAWEVRLS